MTEFELIDLVTRGLATNPSVVAGPGDDCAILDLGIPDRWLLLKTDAVVEGIHFVKDAPAEKVGRKALGRCLSDIAAMGGTPTAALVTLALPPGYDPDYVRRLYDGLDALARRYEVAVVGGETTTNPAGLLVSISLVGWVGRGKAILRSGAVPGDAIFVTGELGGSPTGKHFDFDPRLEEGRWLAAGWPVHAMLDLSDGLAGDLRHILKAGKVGAEILSKAVPISRAAKLASRSGTSPKAPLAAALTDGEDFELLFTLPAASAVRLVDAWKARFPGVRLSCIGRITAHEGLVIRDRYGERSADEHGYTHFA